MLFIPLFIFYHHTLNRKHKLWIKAWIPDMKKTGSRLDLMRKTEY